MTFLLKPTPIFVEKNYSPAKEKGDKQRIFLKKMLKFEELS